MASTQLRRLCFPILVVLLVSSGSPAAGYQIRLAGSGSTRCSGRVEIYYDEAWGTVCRHQWDFNDAEVVCRELDCETNLPHPAFFGAGTGQIWLDAVNCSGGEVSLAECQHGGFGTHSCDHTEDAGVICSAGIRLAGSGSTPCSGRVEVRYNNTWGTVCDDGWDLRDAEVVCRQLGCGAAMRASHTADFGPGTGQIWFDNMGCLGRERALTQCWHNGFGTHDCLHSEDAGVICSVSQQQLNISLTSPSGGLVWGPEGPEIIGGHSFVITCSSSSNYPQGFFSLVFSGSNVTITTTKPAGKSSVSFNFPVAEYEHQGNYSCVYEVELTVSKVSTTETAPINVVIEVSLQEVNISLTSPSGGLVWGPEGAEITRGHSFVITCSSSSDYPQGAVSLVFSGSSITIKTTKPAEKNSVSFNFPVAEYEHQGNYSCVYEAELSSTETEPISVVIEYPTVYIIRQVILLCVLVVLYGALLPFFCCKATRRYRRASRRQQRRRKWSSREGRIRGGTQGVTTDSLGGPPKSD